MLLVILKSEKKKILIRKNEEKRMSKRKDEKDRNGIVSEFNKNKRKKE